MASNDIGVSEWGPQISVPGHYGQLEVTKVDLRARTATFCVRSRGGLIGPEEQAPFSMIFPDTEKDLDSFWRMLVTAVMDAIKAEGKLPDFVKGNEVKTGEDWSGDPAVYVTVLVDPQNTTAAEWNSVADTIRTKLLGLGLKRWPYVRLGRSI